MKSTNPRPHEPSHGKSGDRRASQWQRMLQKRRARALKQRVYLCLTVLVALLVALGVVLTLTLRQEVQANAPLNLEIATPEPTPTPTPTVEPTPEPVATVEPSAVPVSAVQVDAVAVDERVAVPLPSFDPSAPFSYETAYIAAAQGATTGAPVTPDLSAVSKKKRARWPSAQEGFMPMVSQANTDKNIIAVTVDDCYQAENLSEIVDCALENGAKLTIFPIGENLERESVAKVVKSAWKSGMEIENHTYSHKGTYHYDDDGMTDDIWRQSYLLNRALGVNYRQHFFRPKGGDERFDQRTHAYINQLGFYAMALWTQSGSVDSMDSLLENLAPGRIYLFHTTDSDRKKLLQFIPKAVKRGYKLVTLNEMFGLPANETADLSTAPAQKPDLAAFQVLPMTLKTTAYARAAAVVQNRLIALGWMKGEATGVYGKTTHACMALFQMAAGLEADGTAGPETQRVLFSDAAPVGSIPTIRELSQRLNASNQAAIQEMLGQ